MCHVTFKNKILSLALATLVNAMHNPAISFFFFLFFLLKEIAHSMFIPSHGYEVIEVEKGWESLGLS